MPTVAICVAKWLNYSETFIYRQTTAMENFDTLVLSVQSPDLKRFPHPRVHSLHLPHAGLLCGRRAMARFLPRLDMLLFERIARREGVALLHAHIGTVGCYFLPLARRLKCPLIVTFHGRDASRDLSHPRCLARYRQMWSEAALIVAVSQRIRKRLIEAGCPAEKLHVVHTGAPIQRTAYRDPLPTRKGQPARILCVGRLVEKKGHRFLLEALAAVRNAGWDARLQVIGDGPLLRSLQRLAADLGIAQAVTFDGARPQDYVQQALQQAHVFALASATPSAGDEEGIPVVLMEAMAAGVPVVSTWHGGIPELVHDGVTGLLAPEAHPAALAENLLRVLNDTSLAQRLARAARHRVEAEFDAADAARRLEALYAKTLAAA